MIPSEARSYVCAVYSDLLGRAADPADLDHWAARLEDDNGSDALVRALTSGVEFRTRQVVDAHLAVFGEEPDAETVTRVLDSMGADGVDIDDLPLFLLERSEAQRPESSDARFIARLYDTALGRGLPVREASPWLSEVAVLGRGGVAKAIWFSQEAVERRIRHHYLRILRRGADGLAIEHWGRVLRQHGGVAVRAGLIGSVEYRESALSRHGSAGQLAGHR